MTFGRKSSQQTQQTTALPASKEERALRDANLTLGQDQTAGYADLVAGTSGELGGQDQDLLGLATAGLTTAMGQGGLSLSPEQRAALDTIYGNEASELQRGLAEMARTIAAQRGMALSDSPIANPLFAETQRGLLGLGTARARGTLDFGQSGFQNLLGLKQFQENLRQQAFANRVGLLQGNPGSFALQNALFGERLAQGKTVGTSKGKSFALDIPKLATGIGGAMAGVPGLGGGGGGTTLANPYAPSDI